ncbi:MAG: hypothetical protein ACK416_01710, partial [Zestosphaera sp.]
PDLQEAFRLATTTAYGSMGFGKGELVEGEEADLVVWSVKDLLPGNPVAQIGWGNSLAEEVYVSGVLVFSNGELTLTRTPSKEIREILNNYLTEFLSKYLSK